MEVLKYFLTGLFFMVVLCFSTYFLSRLINKKIDKAIYLTLSLITFVSIFAVFKSSLQTVLFPCLLIIFLILKNLYKVRKNNSEYIDDTRFFFSITIFFYILFSAFYYILLYSESGFVISISSNDNVFNSQLANFLSTTGIESLNWNYNNLDKAYVNPYHYFESWLTAITISITNLNAYISTLIIVLPILNTIGAICFYSLIKKFIKNKFYLCFSFLIVFISGFYLFNGFGLDFFKYSAKFSLNGVELPWALKLSVLYPIYICFFIFLKQFDIKNSLLFLLFLPIVNIVTSVSVFCTYLIFIFYASRQKKYKLEYNHKILYFVLPIIVFFYIFLFYHIGSPNSNNINGLPALDYGKLFNSIFSKTRVIIITEYLIYFFVLYSPFIFLFFMLFKKIIQLRKSIFTKTTLSFVILIVLFSFLTSMLLWDEFTGQHFLFLNILPLINIFSTLILFYFLNFNLNKNFRLTAFFILMVFTFIFVGKSINKINNLNESFSEKYDPKFISELKTYLNSGPKKGVIYEDLSLYSSPRVPSAKFNPYVFTNGSFIFGLSSDVQLSSINYNEINNVSSEVNFIKTFYLNDPFVNFLNENDFELSSSSNKYKMSYITENKIDFILNAPGLKIDTVFEQIIETEIINPIDNSTIYILNK